MEGQKSNIVIVGGSLGGLMHGIALVAEGHNVQILERNMTSAMQSQGAGLNADGDVQKFMKKYDRTGKDYAIITNTFQIVNSQGTLVKTGPVPTTATNWDTLYWRLRANFDGLESLYCEVPAPGEGSGKAAYLEGSTVYEVKDLGDRVSVLYHDISGATNNIEADIVIAADGPNSKIRQMMIPDLQRQYVGYCAWRGTVPESAISKASTETFNGILNCHRNDNDALVLYRIPGINGSVEKGHRTYNCLWYIKYPQYSPEYTEIMTDSEGKVHRYTLPLDKMREDIWECQKALAHSNLFSSFAEVFTKIERPFVQVITDLISPQAAFFGGKLLLVGDALATLRPMSALGTNQAARSAMELLNVVNGSVGVKEWETKALQFASLARELGMKREVMFHLNPKKEVAKDYEGNHDIRLDLEANKFVEPAN